eukprot:TRINITY_DN5152_c0_g1_i5.p2 TRINITY_DN5152_c0_g1~~TRINITY_DN5152_c0_g1_i5.p2  ORF type:complete len:311 (-),score=75.07 TRINITY_DN5152_c0_g1_i5:1877-2809(-)
MDESSLAYLKLCLVNGLQSLQSELAKLISNCIVTILRLKGLSNWPNILQLMNALVTSLQPATIENSVLCLEKIYEDIDDLYKMAKSDFEAVVDSLIVTSVNRSLADSTRASAIRSIAFSYSTMGGTDFSKYVANSVNMMSGYMHEVLSGLSPGEDTKQSLCKLAVELLKDKKEQILPIHKLLFAYHTAILSAETPRTFLAACYFWENYMKTEWNYDCEGQKWELLGEALNELVPKLLYGVKYSKEDVETLMSGSEEDFVLREGEDVSGVTVRQEAFGLLEALANTYREKMFGVIKPLIDSLLNQNNWLLQ